MILEQPRELQKQLTSERAVAKQITSEANNLIFIALFIVSVKNNLQRANVVLIQLRLCVSSPFNWSTSDAWGMHIAEAEN